MYNSKGKFRFTYFTKNYAETFDFYNSKLKFQLGHSWDRSDNDKGALFEIGTGLIEILANIPKHVSSSTLKRAPYNLKGPFFYIVFT